MFLRRKMPVGLTPTEISILDLVKLGYTDRKIASELGVSPGTVKQHLQLAFAKLQASNRVDAVVRALRAGYIQLNDRAKRRRLKSRKRGIHENG